MANDPYSVLGVSRTASDDEIQKAYRKLARQHHPDRNPGDAAAETKFKDVQAAYDILGDKAKREEFDQFGAVGGRPGPGGPGPNFGSAGGAPFGAGGPFFDLRDLFGGAFGGDEGNPFGPAGRRGRKARPRPPQEADVTVPFDIAALGGPLNLRVDGQEVSVKVPPGLEDGKVLRLAGQGAGGADLHLRVRVLPHDRFRIEDGNLTVTVPISIAEAVLGATIDVPLLDGGLASVKVPPGTSAGARLRLKGKGVKGGDAYVVLKIVVPKTVSERGQELIREFGKLYPENPRS
jgi:DnaJ-class molecular chaperone